MMMEGSEGKSIEQIIKAYTDDVKLLKETYTDNTDAIKDIYEKMQYTFHKIGIVKYDAFHEMGGKLSFALCMLDSNNNGYLLNVMHSNNGPHHRRPENIPFSVYHSGDIRLYLVISL